MFHHVPSCSFMFLHVPSCSFMFLHVPSCSFMFLHVPSCSFMFLHVPSCSFIFFHFLSFSALEQLAWEKENSRNDKCDQVSICEQKSKNHCCRSHIVPSSPRHWAVLQFAVVCFASAPYKEPLNGGVYAATVEHGLSDACQSESTTQLWLLATNFVRANVLHEHVCALNFHVLDREWGSPQFCEQKSPKQIAHTGKTSVFEPCCVLLLLLLLLL